MSKKDLMDSIRLDDDFRNDLFAPVVNPTVSQEKKEEKPAEESLAPAAEEKPAAQKPATKPASPKVASKIKKDVASKKAAQDPVSDDEEEYTNMTYNLPLRQVEAIRLIAFNENRYGNDILKDILEEALPADVMKAAKLRVQKGLAKSRGKKSNK